MVDMLKKAEIASINRVDFNSAFRKLVSPDKEYTLNRLFIPDAKQTVTDVQKFMSFKRDIEGDFISREYGDYNFLLNPNVKNMIDDVFIVKLITGGCYNRIKYSITPSMFYDFQVTNPELINYVIGLLNSDIYRNKHVLDYMFLFRSSELDINKFKDLVSRIATYKDNINKIEFYKFMISNFPHLFGKLTKLMQISLQDIKVSVDDLKFNFNDSFPVVNNTLKHDSDLIGLYTDILLNVKDKKSYTRILGFLSKMLTRLFDKENIGHDLFILGYSTDYRLIDVTSKEYLDKLVEKPEYSAIQSVWKDSFKVYEEIRQNNNVDQNVIDLYRNVSVNLDRVTVRLIELDTVQPKYNYDFANFVQKIYDLCLRHVDDNAKTKNFTATVEYKIEKFTELVDKIENLYLDDPKEIYVNHEKEKFHKANNNLKQILKTPLRVFSSGSDKLSQFKKLFNQINKEKATDQPKQNIDPLFDQMMNDASKSENFEQAKKFYLDFIENTQDIEKREEKIFYLLFKQCARENNQVLRMLIDYIFLTDIDHPNDVLKIQHDMLGSLRTVNYNKYNISSFFSNKISAHVYSDILRDFSAALSKLHIKILVSHFIRFSHAKEDVNQKFLNIFKNNKMFVSMVDFYYLVRNTDKYSELFAVDFINILSEKNDTVIYVDTVYYDYIHTNNHVLPVDYLLNSLESILKFNQKLFNTELDTIEEFMEYTTKNQKLNEEIHDNFKVQFYVGLFKLGVNNKLVNIADEAFNKIENRQRLFVDDGWVNLITYMGMNPRKNGVISELFLQNKDNSEFLNKLNPELYERMFAILEANVENMGDNIKNWFSVFMNSFICKRNLNDASLSSILKILSKIKNEKNLSFCLKRLLWSTQNMKLSNKTASFLRNLATSISNQNIRDECLKLTDSQSLEKKQPFKKETGVTTEEPEEGKEFVADYFYFLHLKMVMHGIQKSRVDYLPVHAHLFKPPKIHKPERPPKDKRAFFYQLLDPFNEEEEQKMNEFFVDAKNRLTSQQENNQIEHLHENAEWMQEVIEKNYESVHEIAALSREKAEKKYGKIGVLSEEPTLAKNCKDHKDQSVA